MLKFIAVTSPFTDTKILDFSALNRAYNTVFSPQKNSTYSFKTNGL